MTRSRTKHFEANAVGRDFVVGDVHGHFETLEKLLESVRFDASCDRLFSVGDLVNRGPSSERALEWIEKRFAGVTKGNHERGLVQFLREPVASWPLMPEEQWIGKIPLDAYTKWARTLDALPIAITVETRHGPIGIVHADAPTKQWRKALTLFEENDAWDNIALLGFDEDRKTRTARRETPMEGVRALVHGHFPTQEVDHQGNRWGIDTGAGSRRLERLTVMEISDERLETTARGTASEMNR